MREQASVLSRISDQTDDEEEGEQRIVELNQSLGTNEDLEDGLHDHRKAVQPRGPWSLERVNETYDRLLELAAEEKVYVRYDIHTFVARKGGVI